MSGLSETFANDCTELILCVDETERQVKSNMYPSDSEWRKKRKKV